MARKKTKRRYEFLGLQMIVWRDAMIDINQKRLGGFKPVKTVSVGETYYDTKQDCFIVVFLKSELDQDALCIPREWAIELTPLKEAKDGK